MALTLESNYAKKIGLPGYSSHQFAVTIRQEIAATEDIPEVVEATYAALQDAVDKEIQQTGWLPQTNGNEPAPKPERNGSGSANRVWNCSLKQRQLIERIMEEAGMSPDDMDELADNRFGKRVGELNKLEASGLIDELLSEQEQARNAGRRSGLRKRSGSFAGGRAS